MSPIAFIQEYGVGRGIAQSQLFCNGSISELTAESFCTLVSNQVYNNTGYLELTQTNGVLWNNGDAFMIVYARGANALRARQSELVGIEYRCVVQGIGLLNVAVISILQHQP